VRARRDPLIPEEFRLVAAHLTAAPEVLLRGGDRVDLAEAGSVMRHLSTLGLSFALAAPLLAFVACSGGDPGVNVGRRARDAGTEPVPAQPTGDTRDAGGAPTDVPAPAADAGATSPGADASAPLTCVACINAGGDAFISPSARARAYVADTGSDSGQTFVSATAVAGTTDAPLYQSERYGQAFTYTLPAPNGTYTLNLLFAEIYWTAAGQRIFNVDVQGARVLDAFDVFQDAGGANIALVKTFPVTVSDGTVKIAFTTVTDAAKVSAIELLGPASGAAPVVP
jgi:hypothetical protein